MLRRFLTTSIVALGVVVLTAPTAHAAPDPPAPLPADTVVAPPTPDAVAASASLMQVPAGCPSFAPADVAFAGTVIDKDGFVEKGTVRFQLDQLRAGSATDFSFDGVIDVRYGRDSQYLDVGEPYLVGAAVDPSIGALASKVSPAAPLFGGDAVVGLEDTDVECPTIDDPVQTINLDGTPVDSSLLKSFFADKSVLLATFGVPTAIVGAALLGLVLLRRGVDLSFQGIFALGRAAVAPSPDHRASQVRAHRPLTADEQRDEAALDESEPGLVDA